MKVIFIFFIYSFLCLQIFVYATGDSTFVSGEIASGDLFEDILPTEIQQIFPVYERIDTDSFSISSGNEILIPIEQTDLFSGGDDSEQSYHTPSFVTIQEIFPKDTDAYGEYLGLFFSQSFSGTLRLGGVGNGSAEKIITVQAVAGQTVFVVDNLQKIIVSSGQLLYGVASITLTDSGEPLEVWRDTQLQDKVIYSQSSSTQALSCTGEVTPDGSRVCNQFVSPSLGSISSTSSTTGNSSSSTGEVLSGINNEGIPTITGTTTTSGEIQIPTNTPVLFRIEEIYPYDEVFPEFIELVSVYTYKGSLTVGGLGQGSASKSITLETVPGIRRILTSDPEKFSFYPFVIYVPGFSLTNLGEQIDVFLPNGQQIDSVVYSGQQEEKSLVFSAYSSGGVRKFHSSEVPTPGYVWGMITHHLPEPSVPVCGIYRQHTSPLFSDKKLNVQATVNEILLQNTTNKYSCERLFSGTDFAYQTGCNPSYLAFDPGIWPVTLRISKDNLLLCEVSQQLNLPSPKTPEQDKQGVYYEGLYTKRKEKYDHLAKQIRAYGFTISSAGEVKGGEKKETPFAVPQELLVSGTGPPQFQIHSVLPNPKGKDSEGELLVVENLTQERIMSDVLMLVKGKSSKGLPAGIPLPPGELVELKGDIGLPNTPSCIHLRYRKENDPLALFCYPQLAEDESFTGGMVGFAPNQEQERLQELSLLFTESESCVHIGGQEVLCKSLPYPIQEAKQRKKDAKKLVSTTKKVFSLQEKYDLWREKYATLSNNNKKRESALTLRNRELRADISKEKTQKNMFRGLYRLLRKKVGAEWTPLYDSPLFHQLNFLYDELVFFQDTDSMHLGPVRLSADEVDARYELYFEGKLPTAHVKSEEIVDYLADGIFNTKKLLGTFLVQEE